MELLSLLLCSRNYFLPKLSNENWHLLEEPDWIIIITSTKQQLLHSQYHIGNGNIPQMETCPQWSFINARARTFGGWILLATPLSSSPHPSRFALSLSRVVRNENRINNSFLVEIPAGKFVLGWVVWYAFSPPIPTRTHSSITCLYQQTGTEQTCSLLLPDSPPPTDYLLWCRCRRSISLFIYKILREISRTSRIAWRPRTSLTGIYKLLSTFKTRIFWRGKIKWTSLGEVCTWVNEN